MLSANVEYGILSVLPRPEFNCVLVTAPSHAAAASAAFPLSVTTSDAESSSALPSPVASDAEVSAEFPWSAAPSHGAPSDIDASAESGELADTSARPSSRSVRPAPSSGADAQDSADRANRTAARDECVIGGSIPTVRDRALEICSTIAAASHYEPGSAPPVQLMHAHT